MDATAAMNDAPFTVEWTGSGSPEQLIASFRRIPLYLDSDAAIDVRLMDVLQPGKPPHRVWMERPRGTIDWVLSERQDG